MSYDIPNELKKHVKAWRCLPSSEDYAVIVFAETRGKAKTYANYCDGFEDEEFIDIHARRFKDADCEYRGRAEMDWNNSDDRIFLAKHGWDCGYFFFDPEDCVDCCANEFCDLYQDYLKDEDDVYEHE
jgi:hypothetical protein